MTINEWDKNKHALLHTDKSGAHVFILKHTRTFSCIFMQYFGNSKLKVFWRMLWAPNRFENYNVVVRFGEKNNNKRTKKSL